jgi:predicted phosphate transport protein (TIGR00153 family)
MRLRILFLGASSREPMQGLLTHLDAIERGMAVLDEAWRGYLHRVGRGFQALMIELDTLEAEADKTKRRIRNHLPSGMFMAVDKTLFLTCTSRQDDILDNAHEALTWLGMRTMKVPAEFAKGIGQLMTEVQETVRLLRPALQDTISLVHGDAADRSAVKERIHVIRLQHQKVTKFRYGLVSAVYSSDMDFKDIHQLLHVIDALRDVSHSVEGVADILRAMIAR